MVHLSCRISFVYLLAPMRAATAERSQKRYNNLLMLNIHKERIDSVEFKEIAKAGEK